MGTETLGFQRATSMDAYEATGSSEDPEVRQAFSDSILHILRPLSVMELPGIGSRRDNGCDATDSALSEPFSDLDDSYILLDQRKKVSVMGSCKHLYNLITCRLL